MKHHGYLGLALTAGLAFTGCYKRVSTPPPAAAPTAMPSARASLCPMQVPGTIVQTSEVDGGVALTFTTTCGNVNDLRQRVRGMAQQTEVERVRGTECCCGAKKVAGHEAPAATVSVHDVAGGAEVILRPQDPSQLDALRAHAQRAAERMAHGQCMMLRTSAPRCAGCAP